MNDLEQYFTLIVVISIFDPHTYNIHRQVRAFILWNRNESGIYFYTG